MGFLCGGSAFHATAGYHKAFDAVVLVAWVTGGKYTVIPAGRVVYWARCLFLGSLYTDSTEPSVKP